MVNSLPRHSRRMKTVRYQGFRHCPSRSCLEKTRVNVLRAQLHPCPAQNSILRTRERPREQEREEMVSPGTKTLTNNDRLEAIGSEIRSGKRIGISQERRARGIKQLLSCQLKEKGVRLCKISPYQSPFARQCGIAVLDPVNTLRQ